MKRSLDLPHRSGHKTEVAIGSSAPFRLALPLVVRAPREARHHFLMAEKRRANMTTGPACMLRVREEILQTWEHQGYAMPPARHSFPSTPKRESPSRIDGFESRRDRPSQGN